jgi:mannitol operon repressor
MSNENDVRSIVVNDKTIDVMTDAMLTFQTNLLKEAVSEQPVDLNRFDAVFDEVVREGDRLGSVLVIALIDDILSDFYKARLNPSLPGGVKALLEGHGFLATVAAKLQAAYALRWLSDETFTSANLLRKIRNVFAHRVEIRSFEDRPIKDLVASMPASEERIFAAGNFPCTRALTAREQFIMRATLTTSELWMDLLVRPRAVEFWLPGATARAWSLDEMPANLKALLKSAIRKVLSIAPLAPQAYR